jgi:hypothetical protein
LPRKPIAGKGSLWEKWERSSALRFGLIAQEETRERGERRGRRGEKRGRKREREATN